jgi:hypothetical protein
LVHKEKRLAPPFTEEAWFHERAKARGVDFSAYK